MQKVKIRLKGENNMKRKLYLTFSIALAAIFMLSGISISTATTYAATRSSYRNSYKKLEKKCKKKFTYSGSQFEINKESGEEYKLWDKELNRDYNKIKKTLSDNKRKKLVTSELRWIKKRDKKAQKGAEGWKGGSGYIMTYNFSLIHQTKSRIKWLIKNYA